MSSQNASFEGVHPILPTPFLEDGALDLESLRRLIDFQLEVGVQGVAILGFLGEAHKLSDAERQQVAQTVVEQAGGKIPVSVGVRALGTAGAVEQARQAEALGAKSVFVAPIPPQNDAALHAHYRTIARSISIPVVIHDFPQSFGITLSAELIGSLARDGHTPYVKLEEAPVLNKLSRALEYSEGKLGVFGGLGGEYFLEELERGSIGIMTGFAFPEVLVKIYEQFKRGDRDGAAATFDKYMPLIRYEFQPNIGLAFRKHIYWKRGVFATTHIRPPGANLDEYTQIELERIVARVGLELGSRPSELK
ncbi:MAG: dihydrodipicolinate synthase family protein [Trueperaceae bacterium]